MGNALVADPLWKCVTLAIVLTGIPVDYVFFGKGTRTFDHEGHEHHEEVTEAIRRPPKAAPRGDKRVPHTREAPGKPHRV